MAGGKKKGKKNTSQVSVKPTSDETSTMSSELTKKKAFRTEHRNSTERKLESANEILNSLSEEPSSGSKQRATLVLYKSSLKEKLDVIQGLDKEVLELSTEEEIVSEIEETDLFRISRRIGSCQIGWSAGRHCSQNRSQLAHVKGADERARAVGKPCEYSL